MGDMIEKAVEISQGKTDSLYIPLRKDMRRLIDALFRIVIRVLS